MFLEKNIFLQKYNNLHLHKHFSQRPGTLQFTQYRELIVNNTSIKKYPSECDSSVKSRWRVSKERDNCSLCWQNAVLKYFLHLVGVYCSARCHFPRERGAARKSTSKCPGVAFHGCHEYLNQSVRARMQAIDGRTPFKYQNDVSSGLCYLQKDRLRQMRPIVPPRAFAMEMSECQVSRVIIFTAFPTVAFLAAKAYFTNTVSHESYSLLVKHIFFGFIPKPYNLQQKYVSFLQIMVIE